MISACVFIKDCFTGAFCLFESIASLLPFVNEFLVMDLGSSDGTYQALQDITDSNKKVRLLTGEFPEIDAAAFATLANELIDKCQYDNVLYYQADEIWHPDLLRLMAKEFEQGNFNLSFWRIQYRDNFQRVKWFPHLVHRVGQKGNFNFVGDGMTSDTTWDAKICSQYGGEYFPKWGEMGQDGIKPYTNEMILDVSLVGGFRDNIIERRALHAPFWHEEPHIENKPASQWAQEAIANPDWTKTDTPYDIPLIMRYHVGKVKYELRPELLEALKQNDTRAIIGL
jgi:hypothetical protein